MSSIYYSLLVIATVYILGKSGWLGKYQSKHPKFLPKNQNKTPELPIYTVTREVV